jgi:recombination protein RecA
MAKAITMAEAMERIRKQHGEESVFTADQEMPTEQVQGTIPTGSLSLDLAIGVGGLPKGRLIHLAGFESSGKSLLSLCIIAAVQKMGGCAYYFDAEYTFDKTWAQKLGVDLSRLFITQDDDAKKIFEILSGKPNKQGVYQGGILREQIFRDLGLAVVVIDSIAAIVPPLEMASEVGKSNVALLSRFLPPELRRVTPLLNESGITFIGINQVRDVVGQMFGNPISSPGGRALKHSCSVMIEVAKAQGVKAGDEDIGHIVRAKITKNKVAPPFKKAEFPVYYEKGIDQTAEVADVAIAMGIVYPEKAGGHTYLFKGNQITKNGMKGVRELLMEDLALNEEIRQAVLKGELPQDNEVKEEIQKQEKKEEQAPETQAIEEQIPGEENLNAMTRPELVSTAKKYKLGSEIYHMSKEKIIEAIQEKKKGVQKPEDNKQTGQVEWGQTGG